MNIWHDISESMITSENFSALIEIPKGSNCKYELDKETGLLHYKSVRSKRHIEQSHPARASIAKYECMEYSPESTVLRHRVSADSKGLILRQIIFFNHVERN